MHCHAHYRTFHLAPAGCHLVCDLSKRNSLLLTTTRDIVRGTTALREFNGLLDALPPLSSSSSSSARCWWSSHCRESRGGLLCDDLLEATPPLHWCCCCSILFCQSVSQTEASLKERYYSPSLCRCAGVSFVAFQAASPTAKQDPHFQQVLWASGLSSCQTGY